MGRALVEMMRGSRPRPEPTPSAEERRALLKLRQEAARAGAVLRRRGRGGLPASLVLAVMRRDGYRCKVHGDAGEGECGGLEVHHKGGVVASAWLHGKGHRNVMNNLVTVCGRAHDEVHDRARAAGHDSSQTPADVDVRRAAARARRGGGDDDA